MFYVNDVKATVNEMTLRGYSQSTIRSYTRHLKKFLIFCDKPVHELSPEDVRAFLLSQIERGLSTSYVNAAYSVCRLFFKAVLKKPFSLNDVPRAKSAKTLPTVLSKSQVTDLLDSTQNMKYKTIFMLAYSSGLRISEVLNLTIADVDSSNMQLFIRQAKGNKDRYTILSTKALLFLRDYYRVYKPTHWLFYSPSHKSKSLPPRGAQKVIKRSSKKAGILKNVTIHTLRHSFATHLLLGGTDLYSIKTLLGHKNIQSTMVYLHLTPGKVLSVKSPFDMEVPDDK